MSTITREFTKEQVVGHIRAKLDRHLKSTWPVSMASQAQMEKQILEIALASLEAEAVGYMNRFTGRVFTLEEQPGADTDSQVYMPVYTAHPAPVSVPDEIRLLQSEVTIWKDRWELLRELFREIADKLGCDVKDHESMLDKIEMLQGAEPVTTANKLSFEQWLSQQTGTIDVECGCVMTEVFFHWLRVAYEAGNSPVIPDGWQLVPKQITLEMECALSRADSYEIGWRWALAAAPQQEVKS